MKLLWLDINSSYSHSSQALASIHAQDSRYDSNIDWCVVSATINNRVSTIVNDVLEHKPDIIAATAWLFTHDILFQALIRIKALLPKTVIILGGPEFLGENENYLIRNSFIDAVFKGEGEEQFYEWIKVWDQRERWSDIKGVSFINNGIFTKAEIVKVSDISSLVPPERSRFFRFDKAFVQLETTRGCFNSCAFCVSGNDKPVRYTSIDSVSERLDYIYSNGIKDVRVLDRTFNGNKARTLEMLDLFRRYEGKMRFHLEIHPALLDDSIREVLKLFPKELLHLEAGIQSLRENVIKLSGRGGSVEKSLDGLKFLCFLNNVETHVDLIAGLPEYRLENIVEDIATLSSYGASEIQLELLKLLPGTAMRYNAHNMGIIYSPLSPYEVLQSDSMNPREIEESRLISRMLDFYYNSNTWHDVTMSLINKYADFIMCFTSYLSSLDIIDKPLSIERRGILLYEYCEANYPNSSHEVTAAWLLAGLSVSKKPCERVVYWKEDRFPKNMEIIYGVYSPDMKLYKVDCKKSIRLFGFHRLRSDTKPDFYAVIL